jgi:uncharacterized protein with GYD domain
MPKYLFVGSYTPDGLKGVLKEGGSGRRTAVAQLFESVGGRLETLYYAFGGEDFFITADLPDNVSATAIALQVGATGAASNLKTVVLITPEEVDQATKKQARYRAPGR